MLDEFPEGASDWPSDAGRRDFLKLMGASLALAGLEGCTRQPSEPIVPYVRSPEQIIPGKPLFYATAMPFGNIVEPVLAESHMGRPTKIEGNPEHPASLGSTSIFAQASILTLYDPDRATVLTHRGQISTLTAFEADLQQALAEQSKKQSRGIRLLSGAISSPTLVRQINGLIERFPEARWCRHDPLDEAADFLGQAVRPVPKLKDARIIVAIDADFLACLPGQIRYARDFADGRRVRDDAGAMNRLYVAEPTPSTTGAMADRRLAAGPTDISRIVLALGRRLGIIAGPSIILSNDQRSWVEQVAADLLAHRGQGLIIAGYRQPADVRSIAAAVNEALGNNHVEYLDDAAMQPKVPQEPFAELVAEMGDGRVELLIVLDSNPVYTAPADLGFAAALAKVPRRIALSLYSDETSRLCDWHVPALHYLESWSDGYAYDGNVSIVQPLIRPLYHGLNIHEFLNLLSSGQSQPAYDIVQSTWRARPAEKDFNQSWQRWLHDGIIPEAREKLISSPANLRESAQAASSALQSRIENLKPKFDLSLVLATDPTIHDGQWANNGWLQELPKPLTKLTWDNAALLDPGTAEELGLTNEDVVELSVGDHKIKAPVWIQPGQAHGCVTLHLGYGRSHAGRNGSGIGVNAYTLRSSKSPWFVALELHRTSDRYALACTQTHFSMENRDLIRVQTLGEGSSPRPHATSIPLTLYPVHSQDQYAWGMVIDLNTCTGCGACTIACQAENNIPIVGKEQVIRSREMHWIRVDRYYRGSDLDNPEILFQPVPCMHCEYAPCEIVCPVAATSHSEEGLNEMTYNRCVGTRYCSNNCPYKVRRFNFLKYNDEQTPVLKLLRNPDVTVRSRGVMEKCTYCVQRISAARIEAKKEDRSIRDGDIVTACEAACPTRAIVFGNLNDPNSRIAKLRALPGNYGLLEQLNTRPRTTYLPKYTRTAEESKSA